MKHPRTVVLASGSRYRREQLVRIGLAVECVAPDIDERAGPGESPSDLAIRLAREKAAAVARGWPGALLIGSDQVAELDGVQLHKPGSAGIQAQQLAAASGRELRFHTAVCLLDGRDGSTRLHLDLTRCRLRRLDAAAIARYVESEPAFDCVGGFRVEGRGIALFERIESSDPSALIGLPLIALCRMLGECGVDLP